MKYLSAETIFKGNITLAEIARLNEAIDIHLENQERLRPQN